MTEDKDRQQLERLIRICDVFRAQNQTMTVLMAYTLILVALHEGKSVTEICRSGGLVMSTTSRTINDLGPRNRNKQPGLGLVELETDENELRKKRVRLTAEGRAVIRQIVSNSQS